MKWNIVLLFRRWRSLAAPNALSRLVNNFPSQREPVARRYARNWHNRSHFLIREANELHRLEPPHYASPVQHHIKKLLEKEEDEKTRSAIIAKLFGLSQTGNAAAE